jgi:hypothetical protein
MKRFILPACVIALAGCASRQPPAKIGGDTYFATKTNTGGMFGSVDAVMLELIQEGNAFCANIGKEFQLVTQEAKTPIPGTRLGSANLTFKCVAKSANPDMRKDNGVTTIEVR